LTRMRGWFPSISQRYEPAGEASLPERLWRLLCHPPEMWNTCPRC
jgi:hypothetical protein